MIGLYAKLGGGRRGYIVGSLFADFFSERLPFYGFFNNASDILWCVSASVCWFTYMNLPIRRIGKRYSLFMFSSAALLTLFLIDDLFRLTLILKSSLGIPKLISYMIYGFLVLLYGWVHRKFLMQTPYILIILAGGLLGLSGIVDIVELPGVGTPALLEDGTKLLAILNICIFFWTECNRAFRQIMGT